MPRFVLVSMLALVALVATTRRARADEPERRGMAVVATDGATDIAWPLARGVYGSAVLRPAGIDDARARVLAGEPATDGVGLAELAELRVGIRGDDAASREVLTSLAQKLAVRSIIVVFANPPSARVFDVSTRAFEAAHYEPDTSSAKDKTWDAAIRSLERPFFPAKPLITVVKTESKAFYESPWFWVAIGAAALIGGGVLIATQVQTGDTIHLQMRMP